MKIIFFGSDDFAAAHLEALIDSEHELAAVVAPPDKPKGRGMKVRPLPVKELALQRGITVFQPAGLKDKGLVDQLRALSPDLFVVIAYGKFLTQEILNIPGKFAINVHSSLLPKYRGAAPVNWAILNGERETGLTVMKINVRMDAGDILAQAKFAIHDHDDAVSVRAKMKGVGPKLLLKTLVLIEKEEVTPVRQDESEATFAPKLTKEMGRIDWFKDAISIHRKVRGLKPWPCAYTFYNGKLLKILESELVEIKGDARQPGQVASIFKKGMIVATGAGGLLVHTVHLQDAKEMDALSFCNGQRLEVGFKFE